MVVPIVTAINEVYFPGLDALYNSFKANADPRFEFWCIVDGNDELIDRVESLGVKVLTPLDWAENYPTSAWWPEKIPSLYARLQIPRLFPDRKRAIWIDADCIIMDSLTHLMEFDFTQPVAACRPNAKRYILGDMLINCPSGMRRIAGQFSGLLVFNIQVWNELDITGQCAKAMLIKNITYKWGDQSVLSYVLRGNFFKLSMKWQTFAHRVRADCSSARILHWLGDVPWQKKLRHDHLWHKYATKT